MADFSAEKIPASAVGTDFPERGSEQHYWIRFVLSGFGYMSLEQSVFLLRPGAVVLTRPGENITFKGVTDIAFPGFEFSEGTSILMRKNAPAFASGRNILIVPAEALNRIVQLAEESLEEQERHSPGFQLAVLEKLLAAERLVFLHGQDPGSAEGKIARSLQFIKDNFTRDITLKDLAGLTKMSVSYYRRTFHSLLGISPIDCLLDYRLRQAAAMLSETTLPIGAIALKTGFNDPNYFSRLFTARKGRTPRNWRISCQKN